MAIPIRLQTSFTNSQGNLYEIRILDTNWFAGVTYFDVLDNNFEIQYSGESTGQERWAAIIASKLTFSIVWPDANGFIASFISNLNEYQEDRFFVEIYKEGSIFWRGKIVQDLNSYGNSPKVRFFEITAADGLASLKNKSSEGILTTKNCLQYAHKICKFALPSELWGTTDKFITNCVEWYADQHATTAVNPFIATRFSTDRIIYDEDSDGQKEYKSLYDVLELLAKGWGLRIFQSEGQWWAVQTALYVDSTMNFNTFTKEYDQFSDNPYDDNQGGATIIQTNVNTGIEVTPTNCIAGGEFAFLPAVSKVSATFSHEANNSIRNFSQVDLDDVSPYDVATVGTHPDSNLLINLTVQANLTTSAPITGGLPITWTITLGGYYLKSDGTWTLTPTSITWVYYFTALSGQLIDTDTYFISTDILPASGLIQISMSYPPTNITGGTTRTIAEFTYLNSTITTETFSATNSDNINSSFDIDLGEVYFGDLPNSGTYNKLQAYDLAWTDTTADWQFEKTGTTYGFTKMLVLDYIRAQKRPLTKYVGQFKIPDAQFHNNMLYDSKRWMFLEATYDARYNIWDGQWVETEYLSTGIIIDPGTNTNTKGDVISGQQLNLTLGTGYSTVGTYNKQAIVVASGWIVKANTNTQEMAEPLPIGTPNQLPASTAVFTDTTSGNFVRSSNRYTFNTDGWVEKVYWNIPQINANTFYELLVYDANKILYAGTVPTTVTSTGQLELTINQIVNDGDEITVELTAKSDLTPTTVVADNWEFVPFTLTPASGEVCVNTQQTEIRINTLATAENLTLIRADYTLYFEDGGTIWRYGVVSAPVAAR